MSYIINLLVKYGANINYKTKQGHTALHDLLINDYNQKEEQHYILEILEYLIHKKLDINAQCSSGATPLHIACARRNFQAVRLLLENGADVNKIDKENRSALCSCKPEKGGWQWDPIYISSLSPSFDIIELLLQNGANIFYTMQKPYDKIACICLLHESEETLRIVEKLFAQLESEFLKEKHINILISLAKRNDNIKTIDFLTQQKLTPNSPKLHNNTEQTISSVSVFSERKQLPAINFRDFFYRPKHPLDVFSDQQQEASYLEQGSINFKNDQANKQPNPPDQFLEIDSKGYQTQTNKQTHPFGQNQPPKITANVLQKYAPYICIPFVAAIVLFLAKNFIENNTLPNFFTIDYIAPKLP